MKIFDKKFLFSDLTLKGQSQSKCSFEPVCELFSKGAAWAQKLYALGLLGPGEQGMGTDSYGVPGFSWRERNVFWNKMMMVCTTPRLY